MAPSSLADFRDPAKFVTLDRIRHRYNETSEQIQRRLSLPELKKHREILRANAGVVAYTPPSGVPRACHACGIENVSMWCVPCRFVFYCDKSCQRLAWHRKGHLMACRVLRNPDIRRLMELGYDSEMPFHFDTPMSDDA